MRRVEKRISSGDDGRTVRDVLRNDLLFSDGRISRLKRLPDGILLDGAKAYVTARVRAGQLLSARAEDGRATAAEPVPVPLRVLYEDEDYVVIDKPAGIAVHASGRGAGETTLENAMASLLGPGCGAHPVSRLDRGTTGAMLWAKSGWAHELARGSQREGLLRREYLAVIRGGDLPDEGVIDLPVGRREGFAWRRFVTKDGLPARTAYRILMRSGGRALCLVSPETGRTHQIRLHFAAMGCPLLGDETYGGGADGVSRPLLHSYRLAWARPVTGEEIRLTAPVPEDMRPYADLVTI